MASSLPSNVSVRTVDITPKTGEPKLDPVPYNFHEDSLGAPINDVYGSCENYSNECVAELVVNNELTDEYLQKYHEACVKVIAGNGETISQGSGILFQTCEESQIVLVTANHVIENKGNVTIVFELNYEAATKGNTLTATEHIIELQSSVSGINKEADVAAYLLSSDDSRYILDTIQDFPLLCFRGLDDHSSDKFKCIHYSGGDYKKVSTGERGRAQGNYLSLDTQIHIQGGEGASGAPLFNFQGDVVAFLRSHDKQYPQIRYWMPMDPNHPNTRQDKFQSLFESIEARIFTKKLSCNLKKMKTKSEKNLLKENENVETAAESLTVFECLGVGGEHKHTSKHSKISKIESDHFPPYDALKKAREKEDCFSPVTDFFGKHSRRKGERPGEDFLPAITVPKVFHKNHDSSNSGIINQQFRQKQAEKIAAGNMLEAIIMHLEDYEEKGLFKRSNYDCSDETFKKLMSKYREGFSDAFIVHKKLGFIEDKDVEGLKKALSDLTEKNETGNSLKPEDLRIKIKDVGDLVNNFEDLGIGC